MRKKKWISMLLLVTMCSLMLPLNIAQAYDAPGLEQIFKSTDVVNSGNWYKSSTNESSTLAWGESYVLESYLTMYRATKNEYYLKKFIDHGNAVLANRDSVRKVTDYRGQSLPAWRVGPASGLKTTGFFHLIVETGMISYPFADFANLVKNEPSLAQYQGKADIYLQAAKDAVAVHDQDWRESGNTGYYIYTPGGPFWADGIPVPFNQYSALARTQLAIYQVSGETKYLDRVTKMAQHLKNSMVYNANYDALFWNYWYGPGQNGWTATSGLSKNTPSYNGYRSIEDVAHGAIETDFAYSAAKAGIVFNNTDLKQIGNTIKTQITNRTDGKVGYGFGVTANPYPYHAARVGLLLRFDQESPGLFDFTYNLRSTFGTAKGPGLLSAALLNKAFYDRNNNVPVPQPEPQPEPQPQPDTTAPSVSMANLSNQLVSQGIVPLQATAADDVGVQNVNFEAAQNLTSGAWQNLGPATLSNGTWSLDINSTNLPEGINYLRAVATDAANNQGVSAQATLTIDRTSPAITVVTPAAASAGVKLDTTLKATFSEDVLNVNNSSFIVNGVTGNVTYDLAARTAVFIPTQALAYGTTYTATIGSAIKDLAGNSVQYQWIFTTEQAPVTPVFKELVVNGNFSQGITGWYSSTVSTETNGNKYINNGYNWTARQEIPVVSGTQYLFNARTKKGNATTEARVVLIYFDASGKKLRTDDFLYKHKGTTWESFAQESTVAPTGAVKVTLYVLANNGTGTHSFDDISFKTITDNTVPAPAPVAKEILTNGEFSNGLAGWNRGTLGTETNGNKYVTNGYNWTTRQTVSVSANSKYVLKAKTKKGTATTEARMVVTYLNANGQKISSDDFLYKHIGTGWEVFPAQNVQPPAGAVQATIYLTINGGNGNHSFDNVSLIAL